MSDARTTFVHESQEDIEKLNNALLDLENDPESADAIETVFRVAHNLKGNFGVMGYADAGELAHVLEDMLDRIRDGKLTVTADRMDLVFNAVDMIEAMVDEIAATGDIETDPGPTIESIRSSIDGVDDSDSDEPTNETDGRAIPTDELLEVLPTDAGDEAGESNGGSDRTHEVYRANVDVGDSDGKQIDAMFVLDSADDEYELLLTKPAREQIEDGDFDHDFDLYLSVDDESVESTADVSSYFEQSRYVESVSVDRVTDDLADARTAAESNDDTDDAGAGAGAGGSSSTAATKKRNKEIESIRVDVEQIDQLYNQVEEMVTSRIKLRKIIEGSGLVSAEEELDEHGKITSGLQDTVLEIRLVPLQKIVGNFPRVVRDLARSQDKRIDFQMEGVDIEMDRSILNELSDPLMHIIRNAVDHGIEPPEERVEAGKPPDGKIRLIGERERDRVSVTVEDDGRGLDVETIREKAVEKDVMAPEEVDVLDDSEVYDLIFHPGFSTRDEVTEVSGRGVGMDVVNQVVRGVDGTINVESESGEGTSVTLTLPVSVAIVRVLFVTAEDETYGIPIKNIDEISELGDVNVQSIEGKPILTHDDRVYPLVTLGEALEVPDTESRPDDMVVRIKEDVRQVGIRCTDVVGQEEVVIKPFEGVLSGTPGISGASVLGEGEVVMILDVETL